MKRAGFLKACLGGNLADGQIRLTEKVDGHVTPEVVLESLVTDALSLQAPLQGGAGHAQLIGHFIQRRPVFRRMVAQPLPDLGT
ncbi:hypothetical protein D3C75_1315730 [compost metagenome]